MLDTLRASVANAPSKDVSLPSEASSDSRVLPPGTIPRVGAIEGSQRAGTISVGHLFVRRLFRSLSRPAPPVNARTGLDCLAERAQALRARARERLLLQHRRPPGLFYLRHSPGLLAFNHLVDEP